MNSRTSLVIASGPAVFRVSLVSDTVAPEMTAPWSSFTVPTSAPLTPCAGGVDAPAPRNIHTTIRKSVLSSQHASSRHETATFGGATHRVRAQKCEGPQEVIGLTMRKKADLFARSSAWFTMSDMARDLDLVVLFEHPEWQKPLFAALDRRGIAFEPFDLKRAAFSNVDVPTAYVYFNQASPSAYVRGNTRAVPLALAYMRTLERLGARVLNGADVFALELSKSAQATLLRTLGIDTPKSITFNDVAALRAYADSIHWRLSSSPIRVAAAHAYTS